MCGCVDRRLTFEEFFVFVLDCGNVLSVQYVNDKDRGVSFLSRPIDLCEISPAVWLLRR